MAVTHQGPEKHYFPETGFDDLPAVPGHRATSHDRLIGFGRFPDDPGSEEYLCATPLYDSLSPCLKRRRRRPCAVVVVVAVVEFIIMIAVDVSDVGSEPLALTVDGSLSLWSLCP